MRKSSIKGISLTLVAAAWVVVIFCGIWTLWAYEIKPGDTTAPALRWPANSPFPRTPGTPTLLVALHPNCPCSRASMEELRLLMAYAGRRLTADVVFAMPVGMTQDPATSDLWKSASGIPGAHVIRDEHAALSQFFHAGISGQVFLYDAQGALQFNGGITSSRGHEGDNEGLASIKAFLDTGMATRSSTPVYGCSLN